LMPVTKVPTIIRIYNIGAAGKVFLDPAVGYRPSERPGTAFEGFFV